MYALTGIFYHYNTYTETIITCTVCHVFPLQRTERFHVLVVEIKAHIFGVTHMLTRKFYIVFHFTSHANRMISVFNSDHFSLQVFIECLFP